MHTSAARALALRTSGVTYPGSIEHVSTVRADLRALLHDCPAADDVILCASELAANAALHSDSRLPGGTFTVRAAVIPGRHYIRIEVEDNGGPWISSTGRPDRSPWLGHPSCSRQRVGHQRRPRSPHYLGTLRLVRVAAPGSGSTPTMRVAVRIFFTIIKGAPSARRA